MNIADRVISLLRQHPDRRFNVAEVLDVFPDLEQQRGAVKMALIRACRAGTLVWLNQGDFAIKTGDAYLDSPDPGAVKHHTFAPEPPPPSPVVESATPVQVVPQETVAVGVAPERPLVPASMRPARTSTNGYWRSRASA